MKRAIVFLACAVGCAAPRHTPPAVAAPEGPTHEPPAVQPDLASQAAPPDQAEPLDIADYREQLLQPSPPQPGISQPQPAPLLTPTLRPRPLSASAQEAEPYQHCSKDSDCTVVVNGCCAPGAGNPAIGIRKDKKRAFLASFDCSNVPCVMTALIGGDTPVARCVEKLCYFDGQI